MINISKYLAGAQKHLDHHAKLYKVLALVIASAIFSFANLCLYFQIPYNADAVTHQLNDFGSIMQSGLDSFAIQQFVYQAVQLIFGLTRKALFAEMLIFNFTLFFGMFYFAIFVFKRFVKIPSKKLSLKNYVLILATITAFLSTIPALTMPTFYNLNFHYFSIGILLFLLPKLLTYMLNRKDFPRFQWRLLWVLGFALFLYNDNYFLYFFAAPIIIFQAWQWLKKEITTKHLLVYGGGAILSVVLAKVFEYVCLFGIQMRFANTDKMFIGPDQIFGQLGQLIARICNVVGFDFFGKSYGKITPLLINVGLRIIFLVLVVSAVVYIIKKRRDIFCRFLLVFLLVTLLVLFLTHQMQSWYSILAIIVLICFAPLIIYEFKIARIKFLAVSLVLMTILVSLTTNIFQFRPQNPNAISYELAQIILDNGYKKGYASHWIGFPINYFSEAKVNALFAYYDGNFVKDYWLQNVAHFDEPSDNSFIICEQGTGNIDCDKIKGRGVDDYAKEVQSDKYKIYFYNYDVGSKFRVNCDIIKGSPINPCPDGQ